MIFEVILLYLIFWLILCENSNIEALVLGLVLCSLVSFLYNKFLSKSIGKEKTLFKNIKYWFQYVILLVKEVVIANINVAIIVLSPSMDISSGTVEFKTKLKSNFYRTVLANSITLTPGTITIDMKDNVLTVHCLKKEYVEGLINSKFEKILLKIEG